MKRILAAAFAVMLSLSFAPGAAVASDTLHPDVEYALDAVPGGVAISETQVVWPYLGMILEADQAALRAMGSCATGTYCAYGRTGLSGTKLTFTICTTPRRD